jgi:hypothetical protein
METIPDLRSYSSQYKVAKNELAGGHKDAGLRILWALRHRLTEEPTVDGDLKQFKRLLEDTAVLWETGFEWD